MLFDNPFFTCELRQHRRRRSRVLFLLLSGVGLWSAWLVGSLLIGLALHGVAQTRFQLGFINFGSLVILHAVGCLAAGGYGGDLVVGRDVRQKTFSALRLLPMQPEQFVAGRIAFPLYVVGVVWSAGVPLYVLAALLQLASVPQALRGLLISGWGGLVMLALTLLSTSGPAEPADPPLDPITKWKRSVETICQAFLVMSAGALALLLACYGYYTPDRWAFFGPRISVWFPGCLLAGVLALLTASHGRELLADELPSSSKPARRVLAGLAACYLVLLGAFWHGLPLWGRCLTMAVPVLLALFHLWHLRRLTRLGPESRARALKAKPKEDAWSQAELDWIAARWSNPMLLRDLRASLRNLSLRRRLLTCVISQPILLVVFYFLVKWFGWGTVSGSLSWLFTPILGAAGTASAFWGKEKNSGALPLLFLTPLSSREILAGRLANSILVALPVLFLPGLGLCGALGWLASTRFWPVGAAAFSMLPVLLSAWIAAGCSSSTVGRNVPGFQSNQWFPLAQTAVLVLLPAGFVAIFALARHGALLCNGLALSIASLHLGFAMLVFREYERKLDAYRRGDVDPAAI